MLQQTQFYVYNTLSRSRQPLVPLHPGRLSVYLCGITVYDLCHLGHARVMCCFDSIIRYIEFCGIKVQLVRNITDIDDKIINRAQTLGIGPEQLSKACIATMHDDFAALGLRQPDSEPQATSYIPQIVRLIEELIDKNHAYVTHKGDVYYRVRSFAAYGQLSGKRIAELRSGARVEAEQSKHDQLDFALWKAAKPGEPSWPSPWGQGRPGWHIECSAMAMNELGNDFDIHGGGPDLVFPHHENEIAQSCAARDCAYAHYWMHVGPLRMGEDKMSKSLGNYVTIRNALASYPAEVWRLYFASSHYRSPVAYQPEHLAQAARVVERLYLRLRPCMPDARPLDNHPLAAKFHQAMHNDFATPQALAVLQALAGELATSNNAMRDRLAATVRQLAGSLGLLQMQPEAYLAGSSSNNSTGKATGPTEAEIVAAIARRNNARAAKDFAGADAIRQQLTEQGVLLEDCAKGTTWRRAQGKAE